MIQQLISDEKFTNVQKVQAGVTKLFAVADKGKHFYRVMKNDIPLGVMIPNSLWEDFVEDLEALGSLAYKEAIVEARKEKIKGEVVNLKKLKKDLGLE